MQRLHRGGDTELGEPGQVLIGQDFDVLDAMVNPRARTGPFIRIEGAANSHVADGVGRALETGLGEDPDGLLVLAGIWPERIGAHPLRVRFEEPGGATFDDAVDEELGHPASPAFSAGVAVDELLPHLSRR